MAEYRILWVDDDTSFCEEMKEAFGNLYQIIFYHDIPSVVEELKKLSFDLAIVDLHLGKEMEGLRLIQQIKKRSPGIPVITVSNGKHKELTKSVAQGANHSLLKDEFDAEEWHQLFNDFLKAKKGIFLSHTSHDKPFVRLLKDRLKIAGYRVWLDELEIKPGDSLLEKIHDGIGNVDYLLAVLTENSVDSHWVREEIKTARFNQIDGKKTKGRLIKVVPLKLDECEMPTFLSGDLFYGDWTELTELVVSSKEKFADYFYDRKKYLKEGERLFKEFDDLFDLKFEKLLKAFT